MPTHRIFLDANILVTVLCHEHPRFTACARVLSLADDRRFEVHTSPLCLAIGAYFAEKKNSSAVVRKKIEVLASKLHITSMDDGVVRQALADPKVKDLEDGFQYYSALEARCTAIITYDRRGFAGSRVPVLDAEQFLLKHVVRRG